MTLVHGGGSLVSSLSCSSQQYSNLSLSEMCTLALRVDVLCAHRGGSLVSSLSCSSQQYSNLSLSWSEMAFSTVLALRVGWSCDTRAHRGGKPGVIPGLFKSTVLQSFTVMVRNGF